MISFHEVSKRYILERVPGKWVLHNVSFVIPPKARVAVIGSKNAGKSTLLKLIDGSEPSTAGKIERNGRVITPSRYIKTFQPLLTGRQNAKFICRINGYADEIEERLSRIEELAGLGGKFNQPVSTYNPLMKSELSLAISLAFDCEIYVADGLKLSGDKIGARLKDLSERSGLVMAVKGGKGDEVLKRYCKSGIWVHDGKAEWFDDIDDAFEAHKANQPVVISKEGEANTVRAIPEHLKSMTVKIKQMQNALTVLNKALNASPLVVNEKKVPWLTQVAKNIGMELVPKPRISDCGYQLRAGMIPLIQASSAGGGLIEYFDMTTQCEKLDSAAERRTKQ